MQKFIKNLSVAAILSSSSIAVLMHTSLEASAITANPESNPEHMPKPPVFTRPLELNSFLSLLNRWLYSTNEGKRFLSEKFPSGLPANITAYRQNDPVTAYQLWYAQNYGSGGKASAEELERIRQEARTHASGEMQALVRKVERTEAHLGHTQRELIAKGGGFKDADIQRFVAAVIDEDNVDLSKALFEDHSRTITVDTIIGGHRIQITKVGVDPDDYEAFQRFAKFHEKIYSKAYAAASGALADVASTILASAAPQPHHLKQIGDLSATSSKLDEFLRYHQTISGNLNGWHALPLKDFFKIRFLDATAISQKQRLVEAQFEAIANPTVIPLTDNLSDPTTATSSHPLNSAALGKFLAKVSASIALPVEIDISEKEITDIFRDLGLLLEMDGEAVVIGSSTANDKHPYFEKLGELREVLNNIKIAMEKKKDQKEAEDKRKAEFNRTASASAKVKIYKQSEVDAVLQALDAAISSNKIASSGGGSSSSAPSFQDYVAEFEEICKAYNDMTVTLPVTRLKLLVGELSGSGTVDDVVLGYQNAAPLTPSIKAGAIEPIRAVIFLLRTFAKEQFDKVAKKSILGDLKPEVVAALSMYYGSQLGTIRNALLNSTGFTFSFVDYKALKGSQNASFIDIYLRSVAEGTNLPVDYRALKQTELGVAPQEKVKSQLILTAANLLSTGKIEKKIDPKAVLEVTGGLNNPSIEQAALMFELQGNQLKTDADKRSFSDVYLRLNIRGMDNTAKIAGLQRFFNNALADSAKETEFVKLALQLPQLKVAYDASIAGFESFVKVSVEQSISQVDKLSSFAKESRDTGASDGRSPVIPAEHKAFILRTLHKLEMVLKHSQEFIVHGDDSGALLPSVGAPSSSSAEHGHFKITAGLGALEFSKLFEETDYFLSIYAAAKALHYFELMTPSDNDLEFLKTSMTKDLDPHHPAITDIDAVISNAKELREKASELFARIKSIMEFVGKFKTEKDKLDTPGATGNFDLYASLSRLSPTVPTVSGGSGSSMAPPPPGFGPPPPPSAIGTASGLGPNALLFSDSRALEPYNKSESDLYKELSGKARGLQDPGTDQNVVTAAKIARLEKLMQVQLTYFSAVNFAKITESNAPYFIQQLMGMVDLYLRLTMYKTLSIVNTPIASAPDSVRRDVLNIKGKNAIFTKNYFDILGRYKIETIMKCYKNPGSVAEGDFEVLFGFLAKTNPNLRAVIADAIINVLQGIDLSSATTVDVSGPIIHAIDAHLDLTNPAKIIAGSSLLLPATFDSIMPIKVVTH